tara:strand:+ start:932 stop:1081 length:150 start_codon:yes stop_codon:yes gene_type:complete
MENDQNETNASDDREKWVPPVLSSFLPVRETKSGGFVKTGVENGFYTPS